MGRARRMVAAGAMSITLAIAANVSCGVACAADEFRCNGNAVQSCNAERDGWSLPASCVVATWPESRCVRVGATGAVCSFTTEPPAACAGERQSTCLNNIVVACYHGYATGGAGYQECREKACVASATTATCTAADAGANDH